MTPHWWAACTARAQQDGRVRLWDTDRARLRHELEGDENPILSAAFTLDGKLLASGDERARIRLWEPTSGSTWETMALGAGYGRVAGLAFSPDAADPATANGDGTISLLRLRR
jgi:WD40 repeat protein